MTLFHKPVGCMMVRGVPLLLLLVGSLVSAGMAWGKGSEKVFFLKQKPFPVPAAPGTAPESGAAPGGPGGAIQWVDPCCFLAASPCSGTADASRSQDRLNIV